MNNNWIVTKASVIGKSHLEDNNPCQDAHSCSFFENENFLIVAVSDGAGSASHSHLGSGIVVEQAIQRFAKVIISNKFNLSPPEFPEWRERSAQIFKDIFEYMKIFSKTENILYKSLAATAIVIIITDYGLLSAHIGDGRAGYRNSKGEWHSCIKPFKGELANETVFITSDIWDNNDLGEYIESRIIVESIDAFTLLTDGCENVCFQINKYNTETKLYERQNIPFPEFYNYNVEILKQLYNQGISETEIDDIWEKFLTSGNETFANEPDDKTLLLGVKVKSET
jgi:hypothetical protein